MQYLDTSIVVSLLAYEETTPSANAWLQRQPAGILATSSWLETELSSALARKMRTGRLSAAEREQCQLRFRADVLPSLLVLNVDLRIFQVAANICDHHELGVRAGDALHLAVAFTHDMTLCTFDKTMANAAVKLGYSAELLT